MSPSLGFKAFAYAASDLSVPVSPCQCNLVFRCDDTANQATLLLVATIPTANASQTFALQYDADKLLSGTVSLSAGNNQISQAQLNELARNKDSTSDIRTLALGIEQLCPLWCAAAPVFTHKPGCERPFRDLVELSKATAIHVVFDYKYLQKPYHGMFKAFAKAAKGLGGFPVERLLKERGLRKASWEVFGPVNAVGAPPAYDNPRKRSRTASSPSPQQSPSPKRLAPQSPTVSHTSDKTVSLSPDAVDAIQRALRNASPAFDYQTEAINAAVARQLPIALEQALPNLLRDVLPTLFAGASPRSKRSTPHASFSSRSSPSKSPCASFSSTAITSTTSTTSPKLPKLSPLGHALLPHLRTHLAEQFTKFQNDELAQFQKLLNRLHNSAYSDRAQEAAAMLDEIEDYKSEMHILREDTLDDFRKEIDEAFTQGRQEGITLADFLSERLQWVFGEVCGTIDGLKKMGLKRMVAREVRTYQRGRRSVPKGLGKMKRWEKGGRAMLGRRREAEEVEWVDC